VRSGRIDGGGEGSRETGLRDGIDSQTDGARATTTLRSIRGRADDRIHPALQSSTATE